MMQQTESTNHSMLEETQSMVAPSWPLQSVAAVNPFWFLRDRSFFQVATELSPVLHASLFMPLQYYLEEFGRGNITDSSVSIILEEQKRVWPEVPENVDDLLQLSRGSDAIIRRYPSVAEQLQANQYWHRCVVEDFGKLAAAYLDDQQALAPFPFRNQDFWSAFCQIMTFDRGMEVYGASGFRKNIEPLLSLSASEAIQKCLRDMGLVSSDGQRIYLQRLLASVLGWATQFKHMEWQKTLGYPVARQTSLVDLLAVRIAYDYGLFFFAEDSDFAPAISFWQTSYNELGFQAGRSVHGFRLHYIWQCAQERSFQKRLAAALDRSNQKEKNAAHVQDATMASDEDPSSHKADQPLKYQMAFCIDVRSEVIRRRLEAEIPGLATMGFAGFFGLPFSYNSISEKKPSHRLPVLLSPAFQAKESPINGGRIGGRSLNANLILSYFRNLRKAPISSFLFVELFGLLSVENVIRQTFHSLMRKLRGRRQPQRFDDRRTRPDHKSLISASGEPLSLQQKAEICKNLLRHMGLLRGMADIVFLVGHGADTTNNAFASSLDCGACGGHAGDINVRLLAALLNDSEVRSILSTMGANIPDRTHFVPAIHETVTDLIHILDEDRIPADRVSEVRSVQGMMDRASEKARKERSVSRSAVLDPHVDRRPRNWAEIRPEWGLTGNACFIVAPRHRSRGVNLSGRAFLHDYHWETDDGFQTLELIMTAPMVVTNWINMQYYCSSVAPNVYGSGSKVLHNLVNEIGVQEGNGGDLRVGLPIQSVHDGDRLVHEPLRLSVFIEAPESALEEIIEKHDAVRHLVENGWLHLLQIHPDSKDTPMIRKRLPDGSYTSL